MNSLIDLHPLKVYKIITNYGIVYKFTESGDVVQYDKNYFAIPNESWRISGCAERMPFGRLRYYSLAQFIEMIKNKNNIRWTFKSGKPRYTLRDIDHGTHRVHGNSDVHGIYLVFETEISS